MLAWEIPTIAASSVFVFVVLVLIVILVGFRLLSKKMNNVIEEVVIGENVHKSDFTLIPEQGIVETTTLTAATKNSN